jgi:hypothetical protein
VYKYGLETVKEAYSIKDLRLLVYNLQASEQTFFSLGASPTASSPSDLAEKSSLHSSRSKSTNFFMLRDDEGTNDFDDADGSRKKVILIRSKMKVSELERQPWFFNPNADFDHNKFMSYRDRPNPKSTYHHNKLMDLGMNGGSYWTWPYFNCSSAKNQKILSESDLIIRPKSKKSFLRDSNDEGAGGGQEDRGNPGESRDPHHQYHEEQQNTRIRRNSWLASYTAWFPIRTKERYKSE